jgi:hypothetical protein
MTFKAAILGLAVLAAAGSAAAQDWGPGDRGRGHGRWRAREAAEASPLALALGAGQPPGWRGGAEQDEARRAVREGRQISLGQALDAIRRRTPGRQLDAGMQPGPGGRMVYRVRWAAADGRRIDYLVDAQTGQIIGEDR